MWAKGKGYISWTQPSYISTNHCPESLIHLGTGLTQDA